MDERIRGLERAAAADDPEARRRLFQERLRRDGLTREKVAFMAYMGEADAAAWLGDSAPPRFEVSRFEDQALRRTWKRVMRPLGRVPCMLAVAEAALVVIDDSFRNPAPWIPPDPRQADAWRRDLANLRLAFRRYSDCPCDEHRESVYAVTGQHNLLAYGMLRHECITATFGPGSSFVERSREYVMLAGIGAAQASEIRLRVEERLMAWAGSRRG